MKELTELASYIQSAGYEVKTISVNGSDALEVMDPVHSDGKIVGYSPIRLYTPRQAHKFINERS